MGHFDPNIGLNAWNTLNTLKHTKTSLQTEVFDKCNLLHNCSRRLKSVMEDDALYGLYFWWNLVVMLVLNSHDLRFSSVRCSYHKQVFSKACSPRFPTSPLKRCILEIMVTQKLLEN